MAESGLELREDSQGVTLRVRVTARAASEEIGAVKGQALEVRLIQPPAEGKANAALVRLLARSLGVARGAVRILKGRAAREKVVRVEGIRASEIEALVTHSKMARP
jgi:uncharacterized protein (TIGR00251 family)